MFDFVKRFFSWLMLWISIAMIWSKYVSLVTGAQIIDFVRFVVHYVAASFLWIENKLSKAYDCLMK
jgi:hypothetical protein